MNPNPMSPAASAIDALREKHHAVEFEEPEPMSFWVDLVCLAAVIFIWATTFLAIYLQTGVL